MLVSLFFCLWFSKRIKKTLLRGLGLLQKVSVRGFGVKEGAFDCKPANDQGKMHHGKNLMLKYKGTIINRLDLYSLLSAKHLSALWYYQ